MIRFIQWSAIGAFVVLSAAAIWMGALNQDEGWYVYAATLVAEGKIPYRDFFYTQGPLMPLFYSSFDWLWRDFGLLGARLLTWLIGAAGVVMTVVLARRLAPAERRLEAGLTAFVLLGCNLYHLYYLAIPKTYAFASLFVIIGFLLLASSRSAWCLAVVGLTLAFAAGTRISLGALLVVVGLSLLIRRQWRGAATFALGGFLGLGLVYGPFLCDPTARAGLFAAQAYHAARGGFDVVWTVGSVSRLVRWYLPVFVLIAMGGFAYARVVLWGFLAVFAVQMLAPFPYEDYQVPVMALLAAFAAANLKSGRGLVLAFAMCCACSFGSPLLEKWMTNGQDRFWSLKKDRCELAQLQAVAAEIEALDPGGKELLTQDLYLAVETGRRVPAGLEMGPFAMLSDAEWRALLESTPCPIAALSGYTFAIEPPKCNERPLEQQLEYWGILRRHYDIVAREECFGQNATNLMILKRK